MAETKRSPEELVAAAEAFAEELQTFGKLADAVAKLPLTSQKALQRAAKLFQDVAQSEGRLGAAAQALVGAIGTARQKQQLQAEAIQARGEEIRVRSETASTLLQRYAAVGEDAAKVNAMALEVMKARVEGPEGAEAELGTALRALLDRLSEMVGAAQALTEDARKEEFEDIAREADALRQQLRSARDRIASLSSVERTIGQA